MSPSLSMSRSQNHWASSGRAFGPLERSRSPRRTSATSAPAPSAPRSASLRRISALPPALPAESPRRFMSLDLSGGAPQVLLRSPSPGDPPDHLVVVRLGGGDVRDLPPAVQHSDPVG